MAVDGRRCVFALAIKRKNASFKKTWSEARAAIDLAPLLVNLVGPTGKCNALDDFQ